MFFQWDPLQFSRLGIRAETNYAVVSCNAMVGDEILISRCRRPTVVMLIQLGKKAKVEDKIEASKNLEFTVIPQLALADKNRIIVISLAKQKKKGRPVGAKNKVKGIKLHLLLLLMA